MPDDQLVERLRALERPAVLGDRPEPAYGQIWRASWNETAALVLVTASAAERTVAVLGVTAELVGDETGLIAETASGFRASVWTAETATVKLFTLEHRIDDLSSSALDEVFDAAPERLTQTWAAISSELDDRAIIRQDLRDRLQALADAEWIPSVGTDGNTLAAQASSANLTAADIASALGVSPGSARRLLQGKREPNGAEAEKLTELLSEEPATNTEFDSDLVECLDHPEFRPSIHLLALSEHSGDGVAARRALAGQMLALAARHRGSGARNWTALIRETLRED